MGRIRVVGRRKSLGRCVYCHDRLDGEVSWCAECNVGLHVDCQREHGTCPTIGCTGNLRQPGPRTARRTMPPPMRLGERPGFFARLGPYARLTVSTVFHVALAMSILSALLWGILQVPGWLDHPPSLGAIGLGCGVVASLLIILYRSGAWLSKIPRVYTELGELLDETDPIPMTLTVFSRGGGTKTYHADLQSTETDTHLEFRIQGLLPPWWLTANEGVTEVWAYGVDDHEPPYLLEFPDGWLALLYPDDD